MSKHPQRPPAREEDAQMKTDHQQVERGVQQNAGGPGSNAENAIRQLTILSIAFALSIVGFLALIVVLHLYIAPENAGEKNGLFQASASILQMLAIIFGGIAAYIGLYFTWRENARQRETRLHFTEAVNQLGHRSFAVRSGGIYVLERIANDYGSYAGLIREVLTDYIRHRAPRRFTEKPAGSEQELSLRQHPQPAVHRLPDVQAILTVLRRGPWKGGIDLRSTDLRRGD